LHRTAEQYLPTTITYHQFSHRQQLTNISEEYMNILKCLQCFDTVS